MAAFLIVLFSALVIASAKHVKTIEKSQKTTVNSKDELTNRTWKHDAPEETLFFDGAEDSVSKTLSDFFGSHTSITTQPDCATSPPCAGQTCTELCYGPTQANVLFAVCYNENTKIPVFSAEVLDPNAQPGGRPAVGFKQDNKGPTNQASSSDYDQNVQLKTNIGWTRGKFYLARGHLAPSADFGINSRFTFIMTNVAPQWQAFNNGNWKALETALRNLGSKLLVVTGTAVISTRYKVQNGVAVPEIFWKAVCDMNSKESVFFYSDNPVNSNSKNTKTRCEKAQTEDRGIIECESIKDALTKHSTWGIPDFAGCKPTNQGMATLITNLQAKLK